MTNNHRVYGLYDEPFSSIITVILAIVVGANSLVLVLSVVAIAFICSEGLQTYYTYGGQAPAVVVNILFWNLMPVIVCVISYLDLHKLRKRSLQPKRLALSAAFCTALWTLTISLWLPCTFQGSWHPSWSDEWNYCPYEPGGILNINNIIPFFVAFPLICYTLYLSIGIVAWRHSNKISQQSVEAGPQNPVAVQSRYKLASGVYTDIEDGASDSLPSTFRGENITSPTPTAQPPSYVTRDPAGGPPSRRASSFFSEMSHWRRDVEMMSISGTSHMCTCCCHHGVASPEQIAEEQAAGGL